VEKTTFDFSSIQPKQTEALRLSLSTPVLFFGGAKGGGKSWLIRVREIARRLKYPGTQGLIVRRTYPELRANHIVKMFQEYPILQKWYNKSEKTIYYPNGSTTEFSYLKNTDDVYTYQGREYQDISVDEITQHEEEVFKTLRSSLRTSSPEIKPSVLLTGNPGGIGHQWVKRIFVDRNFRENENPDDFAFVQAFVTDNQALTTADPEYVKRLQDLPEHLRKAYLEGDWNIFAGQMFSQLTLSKHVIEPIKLPSGTQYFAGYDYGYNHPFAFVLCALTPAGEYFVVSHIRGRFTEVEEQAEQMLKMLEGRGKVTVYAGHDIFDQRSGGKTIEDQLLDAGFARSQHAIVRAAIDHVNGVAELRKAFSLRPDGIPHLRFFRNTQEVYDCVASQQIDPNKPEDVIKLNAIDGEGGDDLYDALRYAIRSWTLPKKVAAPPNTGQLLLQKRLELKQKDRSWR
jgi:phage terminase large subunit